MNKKYLETDRFPKATLKLTRLGLTAPLDDGADLKDVPFEGQLTLHGIEKPVKGTAKLRRAGDQLGLEATFELNTEDFGIATPKFAGITVANDVTVVVTSDAKLASP
jgi:polyisoprenoid-binding protein YceI